MEKTLGTLQKFLNEVDRLIVREIHKPTIKKSSIYKLQSRRKRLERMKEPFSSLALQLLDEVADLANVLNSDGMDLADKYANKVFVTLDEIYATAGGVNSHGI